MGASAATSALAAWMTHTVTLERLTGTNARGGPVLAAGVESLAFVDTGESQVRGPGGESVLSVATVFLPATTSPVPVGSRVTLPAGLGGGTYTVATSAVRDSARGTPDHVEVRLT
jgi:hypothetical protein